MPLDPTEPDPVRADAPSIAPPIVPRGIWIKVTIASIVAGLAAWGVGEAVYNQIQPRTTAVQIQAIVAQQASPADQQAADMKNAGVALAVLGGFLGLGLGIAGGWTRGRAASAIMAGGIGLVLGAAVGYGATALVVPQYFKSLDLTTTSLLLAMMTHGAIWGATGLVAGLALGIGLGGRQRIVLGAVGGLLGGIVGACLFDVLGAMAFAVDRTYQPLSISWTSRLVARIAMAICVGWFAAIAAQAQPRRPA